MIKPKTFNIEELHDKKVTLKVANGPDGTVVVGVDDVDGSAYILITKIVPEKPLFNIRGDNVVKGAFKNAGR